MSETKTCPQCNSNDTDEIHKNCLYPAVRHPWHDQPTAPEPLCVEPGCGHVKSSHFSCAVGSFCKECENSDNTWEHVFKDAQAAPKPSGIACHICHDSPCKCDPVCHDSGNKAAQPAAAQSVPLTQELAVCQHEIPMDECDWCKASLAAYVGRQLAAAEERERELIKHRDLAQTIAIWHKR